MNQKIDINTKITVATITTTEDRLKTVLQRNNRPKIDIIGPIGILVSIGLAFCSAEWKANFILSAIAWAYFWYGAGFLCFCWIVIAVIINYRNSESNWIEKILRQLKM